MTKVELAIVLCVFAAGMLVGINTTAWHAMPAAPSKVVPPTPAECRALHVGQAAAVVIVDREARCITFEFKVPDTIWRDYLKGKMIAQ